MTTAPATPILPQYQCHKKVRAVKITAVVLEADAPNFGVLLKYRDGLKELSIKVTTDFFKKHAPKPGGYYVLYEDGYASFSPAEAFEKGYKKL